MEWFLYDNGLRYERVKGKLMQIWKSPYMSLIIEKHYLENFAFSILRIPELCTRKICGMYTYKHEKKFTGE